MELISKSFIEPVAKLFFEPKLVNQLFFEPKLESIAFEFAFPKLERFPILPEWLVGY